MRLRILCPAKINLFLAVGPIDRRGYHPLRTTFQSISLADEMTVAVADEDSLTVEGMDLPEENTVTKARRLLREIVTFPPLQIHLQKRIPSQAGLGGGSSDAAGLIRAVQHLATAQAPEAELRSIAAAVGMDVPFFLVGGRARGEGYGQRLTPEPDSAPQWMVVAQPRGVSCATGPAYQALDAQAYTWRDFPSDPSELYNDFERVAPCACTDLIERLQVRGATAAGLTGSGSAVFGFAASEDAAQRIAEAIGAEGADTWVCRSLTRAESLKIERLSP